MASRPGSKAASRSATHFGWGVTCTDIGSPPRALELLGKKGLARAPNVAPRSPCTSSCGLTTCASDNKPAVSVITPARFRPIDTIYRPAISSRYIVNAGANMTRQFGWNAFAFGFGPRGFWGGPRGGGRRRQWFESGDMKYVILKLLRDKPRHGYEVMKELEERMHGCYSPSPGTIYPTLQWLEDEGLVVAREVDGKKVYEITDTGRTFLDEHKDIVEDIFDRVTETVERTVGGSMAEVNRALGHLVKAVYRTGWKVESDEARKSVAELLAKATADIEALATAPA